MDQLNSKARATKQQVRRAIAKHDGTWDEDYDTIDAPKGHVWAGSGEHSFVMARDYDEMKYSAADYAAALEMIEPGLEACTVAYCERCMDDAAPAAEQAATPAPAVPTIEALETELAAANAAEDAALESGAGREVMRAARDRFTAAHQALQDARRADFRRERGYIEWPAPQQAAAPAPAAKEEIHGNDSTKKLARLAGVTTAAFNEQARDLGVPMHYSENRRCWAILNRAQAASLVKMIRDNPDKPV